MTDTPSHIGLSIDNKYRIDAKLGSGGMGTVYQATRLLIGDVVAIKILHPARVNDRKGVERFRREAEAAARLKHPNAVPIYDFGVSSEGLVYLVMELVEGKTIRDMLRKDGPFPEKQAAEIIRQVCSALEAAHNKNIIHRDIKPDNIVVDATPAGIAVKVLDFGIAWMRDVAVESLTDTGNIVGTPHYMSPEQCLAEEPDPRSDIYSIGVVLFEMLSGVVPFNSRTPTAVLVQHVNQPPPSLRAINSGVSPAVESVVMKALAKQRDQRPRSAALFAAELTAAVARDPVQSDHRVSSTVANVATTVKMPKPDWSPGGKKPPSSSTPALKNFWVWGTAGSVVLVGAATVFMLNSRDPAPTVPQVVPTVDSPSNGGLGRGESAKQTSSIPAIDSAIQPGGSLVFSQSGSGQEPTFSTATTPSGERVTDRAAATATRVQPAPPARTTESRSQVPRDAAKTDAVSARPAPVRAAPSSATPRSAAPQSVLPAAAPPSAASANVPATNVATRDPAPPNPPPPRPNWAALATQAVGDCLSALRSNSAERMARLYPAVAAQDKANRSKLLARMSDAASRLSVAGSPDIGQAQSFEDSAYTDLVVRLTWRGNFGQTVNKAARFRATIAQTQGDSHISCRIIGKADL